MARVMMLVCVLMALGGCGKDSPSGKPASERAATQPGTGSAAADASDAALDEMERLAGKMCACSDQACADGVMKEMLAMKPPEGRPSGPQMERAGKIARQMSDCQKKLKGGDAPAPATGNGSGSASADSDGPGPASVEATIVKMGAAADRMCECRDRACAEGVMKEMMTATESSGKPSKEQMERAMKIAERISACQQKVLNVAAPPAPPPPPLE